MKALALALFVVATGGSAQDINPVVWSLSAKPLEKPLQRGDRIQAVVTARVEAGWHLYATTATPGGPEPTTMTVPPGTSFELAGAIGSPEAKVEPDANFGREVPFYEGTVTFTVPVRYRQAAAAQKTTLNVRVRFQACNDRLCLAPRTKDLQVALVPAGVSRTPAQKP